MLGFMAVSGILGWMNIRGLSIEVDLPDEIYSGRDSLVTVRLTNTRRIFPSFLLRLNICGAAADFTVISRGATETESFLLSFPERGIQRIAAAHICSPFPVNFFVRCNRIALDKRCVIFPAPLLCPADAAADKAGRGGAVPLVNKGYEGDMAKITDYTGAEPLKMIHWRLSAKHEVLKVKEMTAAAREPVILDPEQVSGANLEARLSCSTYLVNRLMRGNRPVGLKVGERIIAPAASKGHRLRLLAELAVYGKD